MEYAQWIEALRNPSATFLTEEAVKHPNLEPMSRTPQDAKAHPEGDVWLHTLLVIENASKVAKKLQKHEVEPFLLAALLHDTGKAVMGFSEENPHFKGHAEKSLEVARDFLSEIGCPPEVGMHTCFLIKHHHAPFDLKEDQIHEWAQVRQQVPLRVLGWFARCDSFAGRRKDDPVVLGVHVPSEKTWRMEKVIVDGTKIPKEESTFDFGIGLMRDLLERQIRESNNSALLEGRVQTLEQAVLELWLRLKGGGS